MTEKNYQFWFVAIRHDEVVQYTKQLEKYLDPSASYIIAKETAVGVHRTTNGQHIHVAAELDLSTYNRFHKNIHVEQMRLRRKANADGGKQVGRVRNVRDELKMLSYTCKNENILYKNVELKQIQEYIEKSFPKAEDWDTQVMNYIKENMHNNDYDKIEDLIIDYYVQYSKKRSLTRHKIKSYITKYLMYETKWTEDIRQVLKWTI